MSEFALLRRDCWRESHPKHPFPLTQNLISRSATSGVVLLVSNSSVNFTGLNLVTSGCKDAKVAGGKERRSAGMCDAEAGAPCRCCRTSSVAVP